MKMSNDMNMITGSPDNVGMTGFVFQNAGYVWKKQVLVLNCQKGSVIVGAEYYLIKYLGIG